jgi:hypothetical protein
MWCHMSSSLHKSKNTSRYFLNNCVKVCFSASEQQVPKLINLGCSGVPRFTRACIIVELFVFGFIGVSELSLQIKQLFKR